jgi:hypothetical protein
LVAPIAVPNAVSPGVGEEDRIGLVAVAWQSRSRESAEAPGTVHQLFFCESVHNFNVIYLYAILGRRSHFRYSFPIFNFKIFEKIHFEKVRELMNCPTLAGLMNCPVDELSAVPAPRQKRTGQR